MLRPGMHFDTGAVKLSKLYFTLLNELSLMGIVHNTPLLLIKGIISTSNSLAGVKVFKFFKSKEGCKYREMI